MMRRPRPLRPPSPIRNPLAAALSALALSTGLAAQDDRIRVRVEVPSQPVFVHQPYQVRVVIAVEKGFLETNLLQLFHRALDVPVQLDAPFLKQGEPPTVRGPTLVVNGDVTRARRGADQEIDGRRYQVITVDRSFVAIEPRDISLPAPAVRFAFATQFKDDFVHGRVPVDRRDARVRGAAAGVTVRGLPAAGRPPGFTGSVGRFSVEVHDPGELRVGERFDLKLVFAGDLFRLVAPTPEQLGRAVARVAGPARFHFGGKIEGREGDRRTVTYDVVPLSEAITGIPALEFPFFDPAARAYAVARTAPVPVAVAPAPAEFDPSAVLGPRDSDAVPGHTDIHGLRSLDGAVHPRRAAPSLLWATLGVALPWLVFFGLRSYLRRRARHLGDTGRQRRRAAAEQLHKRLSEPAVDLGDALADYLAARLGCAKTAVITHDLRDRLVFAGVPPELAARADRALHDLVASRYGGAQSGEICDSSAVQELADQLEVQFELASKRR